MSRVRPSARAALTAAVYAAVAAAWIGWSDWLIVRLWAGDPAGLERVATLKGWGFVVVTAGVLFLVLRRREHDVAGAAELRRAAEEAVRASEVRFRALAALSPDIISIFDREGRMTFNSAAAGTIHGYAENDLLGRSTFDLIHPEDRARVQGAFAETLRDPAATVTVRYRYQNADGSYRWMEATARNELANPSLQGVIAISRDISDRVEAEQALRASEARLRQAERVAGFGHWTVDVARREVIASEGAQGIYGVSGERIPLAEVRRIALPEYHDRLESALHGLVERGEAYDLEYRIRRPVDGELVDVHSLAVFDAERRVVFGTIQDVTARKRAEQELADNEAKIRALVANVPVVLFQVDAGGIFRMSEGRGLAALGLRPGDVVGRSVYDVYRDYPRICAQMRAALTGTTVADSVQVGEIWFEIVYHPLRNAAGAVTDVIGLAVDVTAQKRAEAMQRLQGAALEAAANAIVITARDGSIVWVNPAFTALSGYTAEEARGRTLRQLVNSGKQDAEFYGRLWRTILGGQAWHGELINRRKDGTCYTEEETVTPVRNPDGEITHFVAIKQDITARKALEAQVLRSQRLDSVGRLAGGIAHDLNNILLPVLMAPAVLRESVNDPSVQPVIDAVETSAKRGAAIIRQLLTFSRGGGADDKRSLVQWRHIVRDMLQMMRATFPKNIAVGAEIIDEPWLVEADPTQLHQVLMNLCVNARDAMPDGGALTIALQNVMLDGPAVSDAPGAEPGPHVLLTVRDTGSGMPPEIVDKVFDPFFTTKEVGKGTGLGLSTVLGIVRGHRGVIRIDTRLGEGTQVRIYLPASSRALQPVQDENAGALPRGRGQWLLLVDDEDEARQVAARILERQGYRVATAGNGADGLLAYQQRRAEIVAVITDMLMPVMDGPTLIRNLREIDPGIRVLAISGNLGTGGPAAPESVGATLLLMKPFTMAELLRKVGELMGEPAASDAR